MRVHRGSAAAAFLWGLGGAAACGGIMQTGESGGSSAELDGSTGSAGSSGAVGTSAGGATQLPVTRPPSGAICGNGQLDPGEDCDGNALNGFATCATATMGMRTVGFLRCSSTCTFDVSGCSTNYGTGGFCNGNGGCCGTPGCGAGGYYAGAGGRPGSGGAGGYTGPDGSAGATYGDPHLFTADGVEYDFQAVGEFVLLEDRDDPSFVVQVRQEPFRPFTTVSSNTAIAALVTGDRVVIHAGDPPTVSVEGIPRPIEGQLALPHGGHVSEQRGVYTIAWPTGERLVVNGTFEALVNASYEPAARHRRLHGLIGTPNGNKEDDFVTRQGAQLAARPDGDSLYDVFGSSWRITQGESLFDYAPGEDTRSFTDVAFPHGPRAVASLPPKQLKAAYLTCVMAGVSSTAALEACTADVAITGDARFARAAVDGASAPKRSPAP